MRNRDLGINVRVTSEEKKKLLKNAKRCGISLSTYLRNLGLGREINPIPDKEYYQIYRLINNLRDKIPSSSAVEIDIYLEGISNEILKLYNGNSDGNNENLDS